MTTLADSNKANADATDRAPGMSLRTLYIRDIESTIVPGVYEVGAIRRRPERLVEARALGIQLAGNLLRK